MAKKSAPVTETITDKAAAFNTLKNTYENIGRIVNPVPVPPDQVMPSIATSLDIATNERGYRPGSQIEWYGLEGTMKTTLALQQCRIAQQWAPGLSVAFIDTESSVDAYIAAKNMGINMGLTPDGVPRFVFWPDPHLDETPSFEEVLNRIHNYAASGLFSLIVLDSVAATQTLYEQKETDVTSTVPAGPARLMSIALKKVKTMSVKTGTRVLYINQLRTYFSFGPRGTTAKDEPGGGKALRYVATHRTAARWSDKVAEVGEISKLMLTSDKVKYGPSWGKFEVPVIPGFGVDYESDIVLSGEKHGIVKKAGSWYTYDGSNIGHGLADSARNLKAKPDLARKIRSDILNKAVPPLEAYSAPPEEEDTSPSTTHST